MASLLRSRQPMKVAAIRQGATSSTLTREDALEMLAEHGICGAAIYLVDVIPLVDMMWADGQAQGQESKLLGAFMQQHIDSINRLAGTQILTSEDGAAFLRRFSDARPSPRVLSTLEAMIPQVRHASSDTDGNAGSRRRILEWCLDIGAACVQAYPYGDRDRFTAEEKECFLKIFELLEGDAPQLNASHRSAKGGHSGPLCVD